MKILLITVVIVLLLPSVVEARGIPQYKIIDSYCNGAVCYAVGCSDLWCKDIRYLPVSMYVQSQAGISRYCSLSNYYLNRYNSVSCKFTLPYKSNELKLVW